MILAGALCSLEIRFHLSDEVAQRSLGLRAMLAVLVPVVRQEAKKNGDGDKGDFDEQAEERSSMFSAAIPTPVSAIRISNVELLTAQSSRISPLSVNLIPLDKRLTSICRSLVPSVCIA